MSFVLTPITRDEILNERYFCSMAGMTGRKTQCAMWSTVFDRVGSIGLLARSGDRVVGQLILMPKHFARRIGLPTGLHSEDMESTMVISCVNVHPGFRHQGIASSMVREALDFCRQRGYKRVEAYVDPRPPNDAAEWIPSFSAFSKFGFTIEGPRTAWESKPDSRICYINL